MELSWSPYFEVTVVGLKAEIPHVFKKQSQCCFHFLHQNKFLIHISEHLVLHRDNHWFHCSEPTVRLMLWECGADVFNIALSQSNLTMSKDKEKAMWRGPLGHTKKCRKISRFPFKFIIEEENIILGLGEVKKLRHILVTLWRHFKEQEICV